MAGETADQVIDTLVARGVISKDLAPGAKRELVRELERRAKRVANFVAYKTFICQLRAHAA